MDAEEQAMLEWLNSVNAAKAPKAMVPAMPQPSSMPSIEALSGGTITEEMAQPTPMLPSIPSAPMTAPSPLSVAQSRLGSLYDRTPLADSVASQQAAVRQELLGAYTPKKIGWQNAIVNSLAGLAPALVASAVLDGDQYAPIIAKAGTEGLASSAKLYDDYLAGEMKGRQAAAQFDLGNLTQDIDQLQALDKVALQGEYNLAAQEARARLGGGLGQNIIQDIDEARRVAALTGYQGDPQDLVGSTEKLVMDRVNRDVRTQNQEEQLAARARSTRLAEDKFETDLNRASVFGTVKTRPDAPPLAPTEAAKIKQKIADSTSLNQQFDRFGELLAKNGPSIAGPASAEMQALQSSIMNKYRALTNSGATLTSEEARWLQYLTPIAASADPGLALRRMVLGQDGPQFLQAMKNMNTMAVRSSLAAYGLDLENGQLPQVGAQQSQVMTDAQRNRLAELKAKYGRR